MIVAVTFSWANIQTQLTEHRHRSLPSVPSEGDLVHVEHDVTVVVTARTWDLSNPYKPACNCHARRV